MIVRGEQPKDHYAIIANSALRDERLSWRARGILAYLLSQATGWSTSAERIAREGKEGRDAVRAALAELEALGYLSRVKGQDKRGRWKTDLQITDKPSAEPTTNPGLGAEQAAETPIVEHSKSGGLPVVGEPAVGSPAVGSPGPIKKNSREELQEELPSPPPPVPRALPTLPWYPSKEQVEQAMAAYGWLTKARARQVTLDLITWAKDKHKEPTDALWLTFVRKENERLAEIERAEARAAEAEKPKRVYGLVAE